jgi:uncharacterized protein YjeT (DUF2065 family)
MPARWRLDASALPTIRPRWLTAGALRLAGLCLFVVGVGMVRWHLTTGSAKVLLAVAAALVVVGAVIFVERTRRIADRMPLLGRTRKLADAVFLLLRRTGLPLLGLAFFLLWTLAYIALWTVHPQQAFRGLSASPRFADFFYYAVSTAFAAPPQDIVAHSRGVRSATMIEMLTGLALLATYVASLLETRGGEGAPELRPPEPGSASPRA